MEANHALAEHLKQVARERQQVSELTKVAFKELVKDTTCSKDEVLQFLKDILK